MDRVESVFAKIKEVLDIIVNFFRQLLAGFLPKEDGEDESTTVA